MKGFAMSPIGLSLDVLARRYGCRPSVFLGLPIDEARSFLFDLAIAGAGIEKEQEGQTLRGKIQTKRARWPADIKNEIRRQQKW